MNKTKTIIIGVLGGIERVFYMFEPILIMLIMFYLFSSVLTNLSYCLFSILFLTSTIFRAIKIGWLGYNE